MKSSQQYFVSFTIEGSEKESSGELISKIQNLLHGWIAKKERDFGRTDAEIPSLSEFVQGGQWENHRLRRSISATTTGLLDGQRSAWGLYFEHAFEEASNESVVLDFVVAETSSRTVAVAITLYFEGNGRMVLSPPAFVSQLLHFGARTYNTKCCSERFFDLVQKSVSHSRDPNGVPSVVFTELTPFLADAKRSETVVAICKGDLDGLDPVRLKETWRNIRWAATNLSGKVLIFLLDGKFANCRVFQPKVPFLGGREIYFPALDWNRLERNLSRANPPPIEDGIPDICVELAKSIGVSAAPALPVDDVPAHSPAPESHPVPQERIPEQPIHQKTVTDSADATPLVPFSRLAESTERLRNALSSLVSTLDGMIGGENVRP